MGVKNISPTRRQTTSDNGIHASFIRGQVLVEVSIMTDDPPQHEKSGRNIKVIDGDDQEAIRNESLDDPINLFSSVFFSGMHNFNPRHSARDKEHELTPTKKQAPLQEPNSNLGTVKDENKQDDKQETDETESSKAGPSFNIDEYIPQDRAELRETKLYQSTLGILQWQRDNYLVGNEYANWIQKHRPKNPDRVIEVPHDKTALGHGQIASLLAGFIPTDTVRSALLPIVVDLHATLFYGVTKDATVPLIASQQANMDAIVKSSLIALLKDEQYRAAIKNSTQGYIAAKTYRDSEQESNGNGQEYDV